MIIYGHRTLLIRCISCGRLLEHNLNIFDISKEKDLIFYCKCGKENISFRKKDKKVYNIKIECFGCGEKHMYIYSLKDLINKDLLFKCTDDIETCFIGDSYMAEQFIGNHGENFEEGILDPEFDDYFENFKVLAACLNKVDRLMGAGRIGCNCGDDDINVEVFSDRIEVKCLNCGSVQIIYAETEEDLDLLLRKRKITMQEHNISCIDSILERDKDLK